MTHTCGGKRRGKHGDAAGAIDVVAHAHRYGPVDHDSISDLLGLAPFVLKIVHQFIDGDHFFAFLQNGRSLVWCGAWGVGDGWSATGDRLAAK